MKKSEEIECNYCQERFRAKGIDTNYPFCKECREEYPDECVFKYCSRCDILRHLDEFSNSERSADKKKSHCKKCSKKYRADKKKEKKECDYSLVFGWDCESDEICDTCNNWDSCNTEYDRIRASGKKCSKCGKFRHIEHWFNKSEKSPDCKRPDCKKCQKEYNEPYYDGNEKRNKQSKECVKCKEVKNLNDYFPDFKYDDKRKPFCKECSIIVMD